MDVYIYVLKLTRRDYIFLYYNLYVCYFYCFFIISSYNVVPKHKTFAESVKTCAYLFNKRACRLHCFESNNTFVVVCLIRS